ncbi:MAG: PDZ domain-containing protein [Candidatus Solibacter sp.]
MKETLSKKYLAILTFAAVAILFVGIRFRPHKSESEAPSPTETAILQQRVRRDQASGIGQYLAARAAELEGQAVFLPDRGTSGIRYESPNKILTVGGPHTLVNPTLVVVEAPEAGVPAAVAATKQNPDSWLLVVGRSAKDEPLWTASIQGPVQVSVCDGVTYKELVLNSALDKSFAGAGVFDLNGRLMGIAMVCEGNLHVALSASIPDLLALSAGPERGLAEKFGFRAIPIPAQWQDLYPGMTGFVIMDVWAGRWADRNALQPGDLIESDSPSLTAINTGQELKVARPGRSGRIRLKVEFPNSGTGLVLMPISPVLPELQIEPGTPAERAGLRSGDGLVSILGQSNRSVALLSKMLATPGQTPIRLVYKRNGKRSLAEVPHE